MLASNIMAMLVTRPYDYHWDGSSGRTDDSTCVLCAPAGLRATIAGNRVGDISHTVQTIAERYNYGVVRDFVGHGVGREMHEDPQIPNYGKPGTGTRLKMGLVIAIEPMFNLGTHEVEILDDKWTVVTKDRSLSVHVEDMVAILPDGPKVLTSANGTILPTEEELKVAL